MARESDNQPPRFSLRQLLALTTVLAAYLALLGWAIRNSDDFRNGDFSVLFVFFGFLGTTILSLSLVVSRRSKVLESAGVVHAIIRSDASLGTYSMKLLLWSAAFTVPALLVGIANIDSGADELRSGVAFMLLAILPVAPLMVLEEWLSGRRAIITDRGLLTLGELTPWTKAYCERDDEGMPRVLGINCSRRSLWLFRPSCYSVPENRRPIVNRLIDEAPVATREGEGPSEPAGANRIALSEASPSPIATK
ncbi:MAG: hypothetical protein KDA44_22665 [Planctomycetales bacterium]|nr:hypothetical protein [Planctomycetales bacterium]